MNANEFRVEAQTIIQKFYKAGYTTAKENIALLDSLSTTRFDIGMLLISSNVENRKVIFFMNTDITAHLVVSTSEDDPDFQVDYVCGYDKFYINEPTNK